MISAAMFSPAVSDAINLTRPDDWHLHLRDGAVLKDVLPHTAKQFARAKIGRAHV